MFQAIIVVTIASGMSQQRVRRRSRKPIGVVPDRKWLNKLQVSCARAQLRRR
jgi:hypothetical protein